MAEEVVIKTVLDLSESAQKTQRQIEAALRSAETKQIAHQRRLEAIHLQSGARLQQIEARRQAQIDLIRERALQREIERQRQIERAFRSSSGAIGGMAAAFTALAAAGIAAGAAVKRFAEISIQAAIDVNKQVNVLKALTGSAEAAEKRFAALFALAQKTPGLTTGLATTLDAQLRVFSVAERTIDRLLPVFGRLNAISPIGDPKQFVNNFTQLISQNFERQDLKELVGQSPIAGLLIKEIFSVDNPTNAEAIRAAAKRLGITTVERLAEEFADAAANNSALRNATESFAGQFEKLQDRITVALAPVGEEILKTLLPAFREFVDILERDLPKVTALLRDNREEFAALAGVVVGVANAVGFLAGELAKLDAKFGIIRAVSIMATTIAAPGSASTLVNAFDRLDQQSALLSTIDPFTRRRIALATGNKSLEPSRAELLEFAQGQGRLDLFSQIPPEPVTPGRTGGISLGGSRRSAVVSDAQRERDREIKDLLRKQAEAINERREQEFEDFNDLNRLLQSGIVAEETRLRAPRLTSQRLSRVALTADFERREDLAKEAEKAAKELAKLPPVLSDSERFMKGFADATLSAGDAFEAFGSDVARAFENVRTLFASLKSAVLDFFNNLLGSALQNLVRGTLGSLFNGVGGGLGNLFRTPSFAGGGISAPASISQSLFNFGGSGSSSGPSFGRLNLDPVSASQFGGGGTSFFGGLKQSFGAAAPLLGLSLGAGLGGPSVFGQTAGSAGGLLAGGLFGAKVGAITGKAAAFFTNPLTAIIGGGLLLGSFLFGRSKQRGADEEASGQFLLQAQAGIDQLAAAVAGGQITTLAEARGLFDSQILGTFRQQISSLKTKSVRESRLTNQVRDLRNLFEARIPPIIAEQERRAADLARFAANDRRLIPEFAGGGLVPGVDRGRDSVLSLLRPGELVLTRGQQASVMMQSNPGVFDRAGVPRTPIMSGGAQAFQSGGYAAPAGFSQPNVEVIVLIGKQDQTQVFVNGAMTPQGQAAIVKQTRNAQREGRL